MASPIKPQPKRTKPVPAIFANPAAESIPFVSGAATFPDVVPILDSAPSPDLALAPVPTQTMTAMTAAVDPVPADVAIDPVAASDEAVEDAPAPVGAPRLRADPVEAPAPEIDSDDVAPLIERNEETVTAQSHAIVSALQEGPRIMATAFDTTKAQDMMGDMSNRAKGAMEKNVKFAEDMTEFTKGNVEAIVASGRVAAKGMEAMAQDAAETAKSNFEQVQTALKSFTQVKSPTELFQLQSDYAKTAFDQMVANAAKTSEQMMKFMGDVAQPLSNRYALASEKVKSAAF